MKLKVFFNFKIFSLSAIFGLKKWVLRVYIEQSNIEDIFKMVYGIYIEQKIELLPRRSCQVLLVNKYLDVPPF